MDYYYVNMRVKLISGILEYSSDTLHFTSTEIFVYGRKKCA